jgi:hypothetical protein
MATISIPAHFDGKSIILDELFELKPNAKLLITVLSEPRDEDDEHLESLSKVLLEPVIQMNQNINFGRKIPKTIEQSW